LAVASFAPSGLVRFLLRTHGLRRGLHSFAATRLRGRGRPRHKALTPKQMPGFFELGVFGVFAVWG
jgi:hypothetical protein